MTSYIYIYTHTQIHHSSIPPIDASSTSTKWFRIRSGFGFLNTVHGSESGGMLRGIRLEQRRSANQNNRSYFLLGDQRPGIWTARRPWKLGAHIHSTASSYAFGITSELGGRRSHGWHPRRRPRAHPPPPLPHAPHPRGGVVPAPASSAASPRAAAGGATSSPAPTATPASASLSATRKRWVWRLDIDTVEEELVPQEDGWEVAFPCELPVLRHLAAREAPGGAWFFLTRLACASVLVMHSDVLN